MKRLALLFVAACAANDTSIDDLKSAAPKEEKKPLSKLEQPKSDEADEALLSETREGLDPGALGELIEPKALAAIFPQGSGVFTLGSEVRSAEAVTSKLIRFVRRCNDVTGCTNWLPELYAMEYTLKLEYRGTDLWLVELDTQKRVLTEAPITASKSTVTLISHLSDADQTDTKRFVVELRDGGVLLETLFYSRDTEIDREEFAWGARFEYDVKGQPARGEAEPAPKAEHTRSCNEDAASKEQLADWFNAGATSAPLTDTEQFGWSRECHALTGCTPWAVDAEAAVLKALAVKKNEIYVVTSDGSEYALAGSVFAKDDFSVTVGASCARAAGLRQLEGSASNTTERFDSGLAFRGGGISEN